MSVAHRSNSKPLGVQSAKRAPRANDPHHPLPQRQTYATGPLDARHARANALLQNVADIILRLVEYMEDLETIVRDGIDHDIPAHPKRTATPLRKLGMSAKRTRAGERASGLGSMFEFLDKRTYRARRGGLVFKVQGDAAQLHRSTLRDDKLKHRNDPTAHPGMCRHRSTHRNRIRAPRGPIDA